MPPFLCDSHLHLQDKRIDNVKNIIKEAELAGVNKFLCNATQPTDWQIVKDLANTHRNIIPFFGLHPWYVREAGSAWQKDLENICLSCKSGIGEIGLDQSKKIDPTYYPLQEEAFVVQLNLALKLKRPISVHAVRCWEWLFKIFDTFRELPAFMLHGFSGSSETALKIIHLGGYLSFSGDILNNEKIQRVLTKIPIERILIETDSPDFSPYPNTLNEPKNLPLVLNKIAEIKNENVNILAEQIEKNIKNYLKDIL